MEIYNADTEHDFLANRDYIGAANYLARCQPASPESRIAINSRINYLRRMGDIQNGTLQGKTTDQIDAYHFASAIEGNGNIPHTSFDSNGNSISGTTNQYGDKYDELINGLHVNTPEGQRDINTFAIVFKTPNAFEGFLNNLGCKSYELANKYGIKVGQNAKTGNTVVHVDRNNKALLKLLDAPNPKGRSWFDKTIDFIGTFARGYDADLGDVPLGLPALRIFDKNYNLFGAGSYDRGKQIKREEEAKQFEIHGIDSTGKVWKRNAFNYDNIEEAQDLLYDANQIKKELENPDGEKSFTEEIQTFPYMSLGDSNLEKALRNGSISLEDYGKYKKAIKDKMDTFIKTNMINKYPEIYARSIGEDNLTLENVVKGDDKDKLQNQILKAADDGRLTYAVGSMGGRIGCYITIAPEKNKDFDFVTSEAGESKEIFIPGFYGEQAERKWYQDTQVASLLDRQSMKKYHYSKMLNTGAIVGHDKNLGTYMMQRTPEGKNVKVPISDVDFTRLLNEDHIISNSAQIILSNFDEKGVYLPRKRNGKLVQTTPEEDIKVLTSAAVNELYSSDYSNQDMRLAQDKLNQIIKALITNTLVTE